MGTTQRCFGLCGINPGSSTLQSSYVLTYLSSSKPFKYDEKGMLGTAGNIWMKQFATFSYWLLSMVTLENQTSFMTDWDRLNEWFKEIRGVFNKLPDFFVQALKIVVDSWKFSMLLLYMLWDDWTIFMISASNEQLQQQLEYTLLKPDCHSWWISKMQSGREKNNMQ